MSVRKSASFLLDSSSSSASSSSSLLVATSLSSSSLTIACKNKNHHHSRSKSPTSYGDADLSETSKLLLQRSFEDMKMSTRIMKDHPGDQLCSICEAEVLASSSQPKKGLTKKKSTQ